MTLSVHVLDLSRGVPAQNIEVVLYRVLADRRDEIARSHTGNDGRVAPRFGGDLSGGVYELEFAASEYFARANVSCFYDRIPVRLRIAEQEAHYHVPLLLSPWGYSTYRGS
jgi:5-hydroxyisourate hydrolase